MQKRPQFNCSIERNLKKDMHTIWTTSSSFEQSVVVHKICAVAKFQHLLTLKRLMPCVSSIHSKDNTNHLTVYFVLNGRYGHLYFSCLLTLSLLLDPHFQHVVWGCPMPHNESNFASLSVSIIKKQGNIFVCTLVLCM